MNRSAKHAIRDLGQSGAKDIIARATLDEVDTAQGESLYKFRDRKGRTLAHLGGGATQYSVNGRGVHHTSSIKLARY